jgi:hypothetical protein
MAVVEALRTSPGFDAAVTASQAQPWPSLNLASHAERSCLALN